MSTPDHAENTGDNLRHAAEVQKQAQQAGSDVRESSGGDAPVGTPPDFNT
ncbi:hypothetical protein ACAG25_04885 [Mycobacterium sp. pV006]